MCDLYKMRQRNIMRKEYIKLLENKYNCAIAYDRCICSYSTIIENKFFLAKSLNTLNAMIRRVLTVK